MKIDILYRTVGFKEVKKGAIIDFVVHNGTRFGTLCPEDVLVEFRPLCDLHSPPVPAAWSPPASSPAASGLPFPRI